MESAKRFESQLLKTLADNRSKLEANIVSRLTAANKVGMEMEIEIEMGGGRREHGRGEARRGSSLACSHSPRMTTADTSLTHVHQDNETIYFVQVPKPDTVRDIEGTGHDKWRWLGVVCGYVLVSYVMT